MRKFILTAITGMALLLVSSCTSNFEEINTDPNNLAEAPLTNVLGYAIQNLSSRFGTTEMEYAAAFIGHVTKGSYTTVTTYSDIPSSSIWTGNYGPVSRNLNLVISQAEDEENINIQAAAFILKAYAMQMVVDVYGPAPYFEAGQGNEGLIKPAYDSEEDIYTDLMAQLDLANSMLSEDPLAGLLGAGDLLYGGKILKWKKFCNTLHLRMAIRISNIDEPTASAAIAKILNDPETYPIFEDNEDNASLSYPGGDWIEPWTARHSSIGDDKMALPLVDSMLSLSDPRLPYYADTTAAGEYVGLIVGERQVLQPVASALNPLFVDNPTGTIYFLTYSELEFIKAEAAARGFVSADAATAYYAGITASCEMYLPYGMTTDTIEAYKLLPGVAWTGTLETDLEQLYVQKWISFFHQSWEAWAEMRRTDVPVSEPAANNTTSIEHNRSPFRFSYPSTEQTLNSDNIPENVSEEDHYWGYQIWWDTRTGVE